MDIPDGWKLVPIEPTKEMIIAGDDAKEACIDSDWDSGPDGEGPNEYATINSDLPAIVYRAMLAVAPSVPAIGNRRA